MAFPTTGILDDFNRSNEGPPLSASWTAIDGGHEVLSNQCIHSATSAHLESAYNVSTYGPDCEVYIDLVDHRPSYMSVLLRVTTLVAATWDGYRISANITNDDIEIYRVDNGSGTQLGASVAWTWANGEQLGGEVIGSTIKGYIDGVEKISRSDATYGSAGYLGIRTYTTSANMKYDDFGGGTIAAVGAAGIMTTNTGYWGPTF